MINKNELQKLAKLARIEVGIDDENRIIGLLNNDIESTKEIYNVDTDGLDVLINPYDMYLETHEDVVTDGDKQQELMECAPKSMYNYFVVPKVVE
jgi:aspartyl-tRNA(Asn)/glutamyl-tRNA(Gln) amidotransferase subunit C